jgi:hypothetical protein
MRHYIKYYLIIIKYWLSYNSKNELKPVKELIFGVKCLVLAFLKINKKVSKH